MDWTDGGTDLLGGVIGRGRTRPGRCMVSFSNDETEPIPVGRLGATRPNPAAEPCTDPPAVEEGLAGAPTPNAPADPY